MTPPPVLTQARLVARLDLTRRLRDRSVLIQVFLAPVVLALIIGGAFGGSAGGLDAEIWLVDADGTDHSAAVVAALTGQPEAAGETAAEGDDGGIRFVATPGLDLAAARRAVDTDEAGAAVLIPAGFSAAVEGGPQAGGARVDVVVVGDAGDDVVTGVATSVAQSIAQRAQVHRVTMASTLTTAGRLGIPVDGEAVADLSTGSGDAITVRDSRLDNDYSLMAFFAPGMAMIFLFFVMGAAARSLLTERREGTLARMLAAGTNPSAVLLGKAAAVLSLGLAGLLTVWAVTSVAFGVDWGDPLGVLLIIASVAVAVAGISLVITGLAKDEAQSEALTIVVTLVLAVLGGTFVYTSSGFLAQVRAFTPNGQALTAFTDLAAGGATPGDVLPAALILLGIGAVTASVGLVAIRRGLNP
jgi:ABC-2 type transport system permease protein